LPIAFCQPGEINYMYECAISKLFEFPASIPAGSELPRGK